MPRKNLKLDISVSQKIDKPAYQREWRQQRQTHYNNWAKEYRRNNPEKHLVQRAKRRAKLLNLDFDLTEEDIIIPEFCPILGLRLEIGGLDRNAAASLDRLDSRKGYVKGNVSVISNRANSLKSNMTREEIMKMAKWAEAQ